MNCPKASATSDSLVGLRWRAGVIAMVFACAFGTDVSAASDTGPGVYAAELGTHVNAYRKQQGLTPLATDSRLDLLANAHSTDMAAARRMSHDGFDARMQKTGYKRCVENVGWNYPGARQQFEGWKKSSGHDHNMRDARVTRMGIGMSGGYVTFIACG